jgi:hypothetical protein
MISVALESSVLSAAAYDYETRVLRLTFKSGRVYDYLDVPVQVYNQFMNSHSHGWTFNQVIRRRYKHKRIEPKAEP